MASTRPQHSQYPFHNLTFFRILFLLIFQYLKRMSEVTPAHLRIVLKCTRKAFPSGLSTKQEPVLSQTLMLTFEPRHLEILFRILAHRQGPLSPHESRAGAARGVPWGRVILLSHADFKVASLLNAKGLPKMKREEPGDKKCTQEEGRSFGRWQVSWKEPGEFLWAARQSASRAGEARRAAGGGSRAAPQRPSRKAARRGCPEARGGEPGSEAECGAAGASARPSRLPAEPGALLVKEPRGP